MKSHLEWPTVLQAVERKFLLEIEDLEKEFIYKKHAPTFYRIIEKKIAFLKEYLGIMGANPTITLYSLRPFGLTIIGSITPDSFTD